MRALLVCMIAVMAAAQNPEGGSIDVMNAEESTLIVDSPRPLDSAAITLAERFHILVNVEDPLYRSNGDLTDVTAEVSRDPNPAHRILVPKGGRLDVRFHTRPDGAPQDVRKLLEDLVSVANARFPFAYRLDDDGGALTFVPTRTRDAQGRIIEVAPLLDHRVTIPAGTRQVIEHVKIMTDALSAQTGMQVNCCQGFVAGVPWGLERIPFEARDEPARHILMRLLRSTRGRQHLLTRCDNFGCVINLMFTD